MKSLHTPHLIPIYENQEYLTEVKRLYPLPTNAVIDKTLTGIGATYAEISYPDRNSIIVMPNIAIIRNKHERHEKEHNTFAVWGDISKTQIKKYIQLPRTPKKLLITPEAFKRVKAVIEEEGINIYEDYFLLIDESHKTIKDIGYRGKIGEPMKDFFEFTGKAMITATHLIPSDPRFVAKGFRLLKVDPQYVYAKELNVVQVDNMIKALKNYFRDNHNEHYCIFFTHITGIKSIMAQLEIIEDSKIFCSESSAEELIKKGYTKSYSEIQPLVKYNFFTSSFYNGLDITSISKPDIIMLTDARSLHTVIDPLTDAPQITGRFRDGFNKVTHFYITKEKINTIQEEQAKTIIEVRLKIYEAIKALMIADPLTGKDEDRKNLFKQELQRAIYSKYLTDGVTDYFKIDNYVNDERVKGYYRSRKSLEAAYSMKRQKAFKVTFNHWALLPEDGDEIKLRGGKRYSIDKVKEVAKLLLSFGDDKYSKDYEEAVRIIKQKAPEALYAYEKIGYEQMAALKFKIKDIRKAVTRTDFESKRSLFPVIERMQQELPLKFHSREHLKNVIKEIFDEYKITEYKVKASYVELYFECVECTIKIDGKSVRGYKLIDHKQLKFPIAPEKP